MLTYLAVRDLATIADLELELGPGLTTLTGATGAGKSVLVGALGLILGERADSDAVRTGCERAEINAVFSGVELSPKLREELGLDEGPEELIVRRRLSAKGRSRCWLNGSVVPVSTLAAVGDHLIDLHGQHEHQLLLKAEFQLELLDAFGGLGGLVSKVHEAYAAVQRTRRELDELEGEAAADERQLDLWRHELEEIEAAALEPNEEEELLAERKRLRSVVELGEAATTALQALGEAEDSALDRLDLARRSLEGLAELDEEQAALAEEAAQARFTVEGLLDRLRGYLAELEADPARLEAVEARLALIGHLKRKFGPGVAEVLEYGGWVADRLRAHSDRGTALAEKRAALEHNRQAYLAAAAELSGGRRRAAAELVPRVNELLAQLGFAGEAFSTAVELRRGDDGWTRVDGEPSRAAAGGLDEVEFRLAANPGEAPRPLAKVASGGEISRVMLALKRVMGERYGVPTMLFDEIDSGIGGHAAGVVAELLAELAERRQVIAITHLPQIAAVAARHFRVSKDSSAGRTFTAVERLDDDGRVDELAAMLGGGQSAAEHARRLLQRGAVR